MKYAKLIIGVAAVAAIAIWIYRRYQAYRQDKANKDAVKAVEAGLKDIPKEDIRAWLDNE